MRNVGTYSSPIGELTIVTDGDVLIELGFTDEFATSMGHAAPSPTPLAPPVDLVRAWLDAYFSGSQPDPNDLPLEAHGSDFRRLVWNELRTIPYGSTTTYGAIARTIAPRMGRQRMASQAVGNAVGHNPISIVVPCHRVMGAHGKLTGYAAGLDRKVWLLRHEGVDVSTFR
ncbi:methylated-DNA--[protein]-cysteine S-methyltransferase [Arcanobacterium haemolyticum]|nr:methylated-DNA--[protein]-cysteine S-methyltransferase [Arcanobacterium haemolyticum]